MSAQNGGSTGSSGIYEYDGVRIRYERPASMPEACTDVTGVDFWPGATTAALDTLRPLFDTYLSGKTIIELGSGLGVLGLLVGVRSRAARVILTDFDDGAVDALRKTVALNESEFSPSSSTNNAASNSDASGSSPPNNAFRFPHVEIVKWDWKTGVDGLPSHIRKSPVDVVIGSDIMYLEKSAISLAEVMNQIHAPLVVIGHEKRRSVYRDPKTNEIKTEETDGPLEKFLGKCEMEFESVDITGNDGDSGNADVVAVCHGLETALNSSSTRKRRRSKFSDASDIQLPALSRHTSRRSALNPGTTEFTDAVAVGLCNVGIASHSNSPPPTETQPESASNAAESSEPTNQRMSESESSSEAQSEVWDGS